MEEQKNHEELEQYLEGQLDQEAATQFEQRLQSEAGLAARANLFKNLDEALSDKKALEVQQQVHGFGEQFFASQAKETKVRRLSFFRKPLAIAASVLLLAVAGILWWQNAPTSLSNDDLFAQHFETYPMSDLVRGENDQENVFGNAVQQYELGDYEGAQASFETLISEKPNDIPLVFGLANAYLNEQPPQLDLALRYFQQVADDGNTAYVPKAKWYMALIYLKKGEREKAKNLLQEIKGMDKNAAALLSKM